MQNLAHRIASFPAQALARTKAALAAGELPLGEGLIQETHLFNQCVADPQARARMQAFLDLGGQTRAVETGAQPLGGGSR